jgi:hypothetical protein
MKRYNIVKPKNTFFTYDYVHGGCRKEIFDSNFWEGSPLKIGDHIRVLIASEGEVFVYLKVVDLLDNKAQVSQISDEDGEKIHSFSAIEYEVINDWRNS